MEQSMRVWSILLLVMSLMTTTIFALAVDNYQPSLGGSTSRFLAQSYGAAARRMTCNNYPRVCAAKGSHGPDCCGRRCVNVMTDKFNCGKCRKRCRYIEICCGGRCVNPSVDERNCGSCGNKCTKGSSCFYGMCSYAK